MTATSPLHATTPQPIEPSSVAAPEPLARLSDVEQYRVAFEHYRRGDWDDERWTAFRLRFGIYGQRQPGVQMARIKIPGGVLPIHWARAIARANRVHAKGDLHITTRQDVQLYSVPLAATPALLADLHAAGLTTREACGNTLRNMNACALAGACPRERVDAGEVARRLTRSWLRHPLVQHMPRKFKISVSGCATDCGAASIHDLGLVAIERDGEPGFRVYAGGGLGGAPRGAILLNDFVTDDELPAVVEALVRLHQKYSNRVNRNAARIKFLVKRFGEVRFRDLFLEAFERAKALPQRPWRPLDWRAPEEAPAPTSPGGIVRQPNGRMAVVARPRLGLLTSDQLDGLADIAESFAFEGLRTTREQNLVILGIDATAVREVVEAVRALGISVVETDIEAPGDEPDVVACPGTTTCRIGITNSQNFGREIIEQVRGYAAKPNLRVRVSVCQNGCGLHHVGDFGFRGMGKKIGGRPAPHYQIYLGGDDRRSGAIALAGPIVPARRAKQALALLTEGHARAAKHDESVRAWAERLGKDGLAELLAPLARGDEADPSGEADLFVDWGEADGFTPPKATRAECAAPFALDALFKDLADDGLITVDRALAGDDPVAARAAGREALAYAVRRLLVRLALPSGDNDPLDDLIARVRAAYPGDAAVIGALDRLIAAEAEADTAPKAWREALAVVIDTAEVLAETPVEATPAGLGKLDDFDASVLDLIQDGRENPGVVAAE